MAFDPLSYEIKSISDKESSDFYYNKIKSSGKKIRLFIDGSNIFSRGYFAMKDQLFNSKGEETGGFYNTLRTIIIYAASIAPSEINVVFDIGKSVRHANLYKDYKANREKIRASRAALIGPEMAAEEKQSFLRQRYNVMRFCFDANIRVYPIKGVEGDSVLAYIVKRSRQINDNYINIIISSDKDFIQLLDTSEDLYIFSPYTRKFITIDNYHDKVDKKVSLLPWIPPSMLSMIRSVSGDASDNIPGVSGVGIATMNKILDKAYMEGTKITSLQELFEYIENKDKSGTKLLKAEKGILENRDLLNINIKLMDLINVEKYMSSNSISKIEDILSKKIKLNKSGLWNLFVDNDFESFLVNFNKICGLLNRLNK